MLQLMFLINSVFFGFAIFNIFYTTQKFSSKKSLIGSQLVSVIDKLIVWNGVLFAACTGFQTLTLWLFLKNTENNSGEEVVLHSNYQSFFLAFSVLVIGSQIFRFKKVKTNDTIRTFISILMLWVLKFIDCRLIMTMIHRDGLSQSSSFLIKR